MTAQNEPTRKGRKPSFLNYKNKMTDEYRLVGFFKWSTKKIDDFRREIIKKYPELFGKDLI